MPASGSHRTRQPRLERWYRCDEHVLDALNKDEGHLRPYILWQLPQILLVRSRQDDAAQLGPVGCQHFLLDTANGEDQPG